MQNPICSLAPTTMNQTRSKPSPAGARNCTPFDQIMQEVDFTEVTEYSGRGFSESRPVLTKASLSHILNKQEDILCNLMACFLHAKRFPLCVNGSQ